MNEKLPDDKLAAFAGEGYLVLNDVYTREEVSELIRQFDLHWVRLTASGQIIQNGNRPLESLYPRLRDYHRKNEKIKRLSLKPQLFDYLEQLIGEEALIISTSYYFKSPSTRGLPLHQDNYAFGVSPGTTYAAWISLDSSDEDNGGMTFVPGTHSLDLQVPEGDASDVRRYFSDEGQWLKDYETAEMVKVATNPGDVIFFNGNIVHGSSDNLSRHRFRRSLLIHFTGVSVEKLALNFNNLMDKTGARVRRRLNTDTKITEGQDSVFSIQEADYFAGWR
ncbi:phytanoyl-CoA dioxygenase [Paenibacillus chitinolyticus]|uniref:Phytanoyl-CoA dioxygenase n=1 Tax=Paenibacillus chitinolyticus TaxID=79263 RepID=A0A410WSG3_9BACL|nr:phytanoyl-CoA dioxygenase family protein [Paenibacillus chitinolyticus]MCY9591254.1 phytanoyl-CoA dioxygenase family protein [Paenibacillus chitinolyticus]MCY9595563.1 phytanoyl-CoA dioxygenase family protein [Paenibacillus chitinolyticus]QAV17328.1 phytanoyl-CoA dioxygenase [Paenibacillus chitinolyticus]